MTSYSNTVSRFRPVEIGNIDGKRVVVEAVPEAMPAFGGVTMQHAVREVQYS